MKFIADLHIHSHFSRATSKDLTPENLSIWAQKKGITVIGTGDFTHPGWISELKEKLVEAEGGLYMLREDLRKDVASNVPPSCADTTRFLFSGEISCIYKKNGKTRKLHHLILMPDFASVSRLNKKLERVGNLSSDGRPIFGLDSKNLLEMTLEASEKAFFIPAHIWTPWFSLFGSRSGFDTIEECFEDLSHHIYALETGLSSDPPMNRVLSCLDGYLLVSNSDAHSPGKLGREANLFETELDYYRIIQAMTDGNGFEGTIEFFPEEGKYHLDGHRKCGVRLQPAETKRIDNICPVCGQPLTVGVLHRVHDLSDRDMPEMSKAFYSLIPLHEVLSQLLGKGPSTKKVVSFYERLLVTLGPELNILLNISLDNIEAAGGPLLRVAIDRMRRSEVIREGGYDGEYGTIRLLEDSEKETLSGQTVLFESKGNRGSAPALSAIPLRERYVDEEMDKVPQAPPIPKKDPVLGPLNPEQRRAVSYQGGHLLVVAGPGTGKTMTLTHRIAHLILSETARPEQILALTFTRKAATEVKERVSGMVKSSWVDRICISTFHRFCLNVLRADGDKIGIPDRFILCSEGDSVHIAEEILGRSGMGRRSIRKFLRALPAFRIATSLGQSMAHFDQDIASMFGNYQRMLRDFGMLDLDDLEMETLKLFDRFPDICQSYGERFPWIFVDEYQDTNPVQVELLKMLVYGSSRRVQHKLGDRQVSNCDRSVGAVFAIGDADQAIYAFRGADVSNFYRFTQDFSGAEIITLNRNYRSTGSILQCSSGLMEKETPLKGESADGLPVIFVSCLSAPEEAEMIVEQIEKFIGGTSYFSLDSGRVASHEGELSYGFGDIAILYRINAQGDAIAEALDRGGIPFVRSGELPLVNIYPVDILQRFFQILLFPDNPYYLRAYADLMSWTPHQTRRRVQEFDVGNLSSLTELIDKAVEFHGLDCSSDAAQDALRRLKEIATDMEENDMALFLDFLSLERGIDHSCLLGDRVALMTLHASKGLEWPLVFITGCEDRLLPYSLFGDKDINVDEERRLLYVGMTRARHRLVLSHVKQRSIKGRIYHVKPSPFLDDIPEGSYESLNHDWHGIRKREHSQLRLFDMGKWT